MRTLTANDRRQSATAAVGDWWQRWRQRIGERRELEKFSADEVARYAQDVGVSSADLHALVGRGDDNTPLLEHRMACLHIDRAELARTDPATLRDMQRLCSLCRSRGRCARDLADEDADPTWQEWRDYCPNSTTLTILGTMQDCQRAPAE